jgi:hypothetical protein
MKRTIYDYSPVVKPSAGLTILSYIISKFRGLISYSNSFWPLKV